MTLEQIKLKIGERVDDDTAVAYAARYQGIFVSAMIDVVKAVDKNGNALFSSSEYPELVGPYEPTGTITDGFMQIQYSAINAIFVRDVFSNVISVNINKRINFQSRSFKKLIFIRGNPHLAPTLGEGYWAEKSNSVFILIAANQKAEAVLPFSLDIISNPKPGDWGSDDLEATHHYGRSFIEACIKRSVEILKSEIGVE